MSTNIKENGFDLAFNLTYNTEGDIFIRPQ